MRVFLYFLKIKKFRWRRKNWGIKWGNFLFAEKSRSKNQTAS